MFIFVLHKDPPELSAFRRRSLSLEPDLAVEKSLVLNPNCPVRIMLEYIRKKCKLAANTQFDLCEENGQLKGLFGYPTYAYATTSFDHKKSYYLVVLKQESEKSVQVFPQVNRDNKLYPELHTRIKKYLLTGESSPQQSQSVKEKPAKKK